MKKSILIVWAVITTFSLTAFCFINWNHENKLCLTLPSYGTTNQANTMIGTAIGNMIDINFDYAVGTRYAPITKGEVDRATSVIDFLPADHVPQIVSFNEVSVFIMDHEKLSETLETGNGATLTSAQLGLLKSCDYSTNFLIRAEYIQKNMVTGEFESSFCNPRRTIVPEKQAAYLPGNEALLDYLKENNKENINLLDNEKLQAAKLYFTVNKMGNISNIYLDKTSGYPMIDNYMMELIKNAPGQWEVAENALGEKVDQELVLSFGILGC